MTGRVPRACGRNPAALQRLPDERAAPCAPGCPLRASAGPGPASWGLNFCHLGADTVTHPVVANPLVQRGKERRSGRGDPG